MPHIQLDNWSVRLGYDELGAGSPIVLIHTAPLDRVMWGPQLDRLAKSGRVLAPDLPGFGDSDALVRSESIETQAGVVADFLNVIGVREKVALIGAGTGADVALAMVRRRPNRVCGLVLVGVDAGDADPSRSSVLHDAESLPQWVCHESTAAVRRILARQPASAVNRAADLLRSRPKPEWNPGRRAVPVLVLTGEHDELTPPAKGRAVAEAIPGSEFLVLPGAGHLCNLDNPTAFNSAVRFFLAKLTTVPNGITRVPRWDPSGATLPFPVSH